MRFLAPLPEIKLGLLGLHDLVFCFLFKYLLLWQKQDPKLQLKRKKKKLFQNIVLRNLGKPKQSKTVNVEAGWELQEFII